MADTNPAATPTKARAKTRAKKITPATIINPNPNTDPDPIVGPETLAELVDRVVYTAGENLPALYRDALAIIHDTRKPRKADRVDATPDALAGALIAMGLALMAKGDSTRALQYSPGGLPAQSPRRIIGAIIDDRAGAAAIPGSADYRKALK